MAIKTLIIDDDAVASAILQRYCNRTKLIQVEGICATAVEALTSSALSEAELIFLDVEMPTMNGFDFLNECDHQPMVIFTTSKAEYAMEAFDYHAVDFLKKPFNYARFQQALAKVKEEQLKQVEYVPPVSISKHIFLKEDSRWVRILLDDILYFQNEGDYVKVKTKKSQFLIYRTMKSVAASLDTPNFLRIHRSFIVNIEQIVDIEDNSLVIDRKVIPIGKAHKSKLMQALPRL